jgi:hypothetical protein
VIINNARKSPIGGALMEGGRLIDFDSLTHSLGD